MPVGLGCLWVLLMLFSAWAFVSALPHVSVSAVSAIIDAIAAMAMSAAVIVGVIGLSTWRTELRGRARHEAARQLAKACLRFKDQFMQSRSPIGFQSEWTGRIVAESETEKERNLRNMRFAWGGRLEEIRNVLVEVQETAWEAQIALGHDTSSLIAPLIKAYLHLYADVYLVYDTEIERAQTGMRNPEMDHLLVEARNRLFAKGDDEIALKVNQVIEDILKHLRVYI